eukprot:7668366-Lingulodinium_polyedra.AAC.1
MSSRSALEHPFTGKAAFVKQSRFAQSVRPARKHVCALGGCLFGLGVKGMCQHRFKFSDIAPDMATHAPDTIGICVINDIARVDINSRYVFTRN